MGEFAEDQEGGNALRSLEHSCDAGAKFASEDRRGFFDVRVFLQYVRDRAYFVGLQLRACSRCGLAPFRH